MIGPRRFSLERNDGRIWIAGPINPDGVSVAALRRSFAEIDPDGPVRVMLATPGGSYVEGLAMYLALRECGRPVEITVRRAASVGSLVAMAGTRIEIEPTGCFFLHGAGYVRDALSGLVPHMTAETFRHAARSLDRADAVVLDVLTRRTGLPRHELAALHASDTTLNAERAVALGFADSIASPEI
ncbi:Clp protease ClpP [Methylobacterium sp. J-077]|uniref:Clp protease ClpP n=1 Tax=Methylobacterium sp. J-077 TaxID=2836656 RepID=UPI001FB9DA51|nr:Clp protease ClpP [Methylobacterium sp. J-077]MCJ2125110.1 Clp protease ClpP [Methylobacterium sp. J-077]